MMRPTRTGITNNIYNHCSADSKTEESLENALVTCCSLIEKM